jgi:hypothetical protein
MSEELIIVFAGFVYNNGYAASYEKNNKIGKSVYTGSPW